MAAAQADEAAELAAEVVGEATDRAELFAGGERLATAQGSLLTTVESLAAFPVGAVTGPAE